MGGAACVIIINGNQAYATVENLYKKYPTINTADLMAAINASCQVVTYTSLYMKIGGDYLGAEYTQPVIDLHRRIINELTYIKKGKNDIQMLVDELTNLLMTASTNIISAVET